VDSVHFLDSVHSVTGMGPTPTAPPARGCLLLKL
jgi:hypothetical protein